MSDNDENQGTDKKYTYSAANAEKIIEAKLKNFQEWVRRKNIGDTCSECGKGPFAILGVDKNSTVLPLESIFQFYKTYAFECMNCGYIKQFSTATIERELAKEKNSDE